jgi:hypothetical protein
MIYIRIIAFGGSAGILFFFSFFFFSRSWSRCFGRLICDRSSSERRRIEKWNPVRLTDTGVDQLPIVMGTCMHMDEKVGKQERRTVGTWREKGFEGESKKEVDSSHTSALASSAKALPGFRDIGAKPLRDGLSKICQ